MERAVEKLKERVDRLDKQLRIDAPTAVIRKETRLILRAAVRAWWKARWYKSKQGD